MRTPQHNGAVDTVSTGPALSPHLLGIIFLLIASVLWSLNGALIKLSTQSGAGPTAIAFYRSLFAGLFLLPLGARRLHTLRSVEPGNRSLIRPAALTCMVLFTVMTVSFVLANTLTKAANAVLLQYTSTFWIFGLSPWMLGERARTKDLWLLGLAMLGIAVIFAGNAGADAMGCTIALGSGLCFGLLTMMIRRLRDSDSAAVTVFNNLGSALLLLPVCALMGGLTLSTRSLVLLIIMGIVQFGTPYYLYSLGLARVPAYQAALITMLEPVLVPVWTYLAVGETVPGATIAGGAIILLALALFIRAAQRTPRKEPA